MIYDESTNEVQIDEKKVNKILKRIIIEETKNIKSQDKSDQQMVQIIKGLIEEEVKCY